MLKHTLLKKEQNVLDCPKNIKSQNVSNFKKQLIIKILNIVLHIHLIYSQYTANEYTLSKINLIKTNSFYFLLQLYIWERIFFFYLFIFWRGSHTFKIEFLYSLGSFESKKSGF